MMTNSDRPEPDQYASPPCYMHELDPGYFGLGLETGTAGADAARWRNAERKRLLAQRLALAPPTRADHGRHIFRRLDALIDDGAGPIVGAYWPIRGEPDLRPWLEDLDRRSVRTALPVVVAKAAPLVFRCGVGARGIWNIPTPADGEEVQPHIVVAPGDGGRRQLRQRAIEEAPAVSRLVFLDIHYLATHVPGPSCQGDLGRP
jgi:hypothetical protein